MNQEYELHINYSNGERLYDSTYKYRSAAVKEGRTMVRNKQVTYSDTPKLEAVATSFYVRKVTY